MSYTSLMNYLGLGVGVAQLLGIPVVASPVLRWDQAFMARGRVVAGEPAQLAYRIRMDSIKAEMRRDLDRQLDAFAARVGVTR